MDMDLEGESDAWMGPPKEPILFPPADNLSCGSLGNELVDIFPPVSSKGICGLATVFVLDAGSCVTEVPGLCFLGDT